MSANPVILRSLKVIEVVVPVSFAFVTPIALRLLTEDEKFIISLSLIIKTIICACTRSKAYLFTISSQFPLADTIVELYNRIQSHHKHVARSKRRTVYI